MRGNKRQFTKRRLNDLAHELRRRDAAEIPAGTSLLGQEVISATPVVRYRNYCSCGDAWLSDKQEPFCRRHPLCKSTLISYEIVTDPSVKS